MRLIGSPSPKLTLGWNHEFSVGLTAKLYVLEHSFQSTAEFRNHKDHGLTQCKAHGTDFHMLGAVCELHLSYAEWLQEVWNHCSSKGGNAQREQSIPPAQRSPQRHKQSRLNETISLHSQHRESCLRNCHLDQLEEKFNLSAHFAAPSVICLLPTAKWWAVANWICWDWSKLSLHNFTRELKKAAACKPRNFPPFFDLLEGLELWASQGMQVL